MLSWSARSIARRSMPMPHPPDGGKPYSRLLQKPSSTCMASSSPCMRGVVFAHQPTAGRQADQHQEAGTNRALGGRLVLEHLALLDGVVELGVRVADLAAVDEELEALCEAGLASVPLGERRHDLRVVADEARVQQLRL